MVTGKVPLGGFTRYHKSDEPTRLIRVRGTLLKVMPLTGAPAPTEPTSRMRSLPVPTVWDQLRLKTPGAVVVALVTLSKAMPAAAAGRGPPRSGGLNSGRSSSAPTTTSARRGRGTNSG